MSDVTGIDVLLVEDNHDEAKIVERMLYEHGTDEWETPGERVEVDRIHHADRLERAVDHLVAGDVDIVLLDLMLPDSRGLDTVETLVNRAPELPVVVLTGHDETMGVEAIQRGAQDYLVKGTFDGELVYRSIRYAIERKRQQRDLTDTNHKLALLNRIIRTDIRNEMSVVLGWADVLSDHVEADDQEAFESMLTAARNVVQLADVAADVTRTLEENTDVALDPRDLRTVLDGETDRFRTDRPTVSLSVEYHVPEAEPVTVRATPMLGTALTQLFSIAAGTDPNSKTAVDVTVDVTDDEAIVSIFGEHPDLTDEQRTFLTGADRQTSENTGISTELYLLRAIVDRFDGTIRVDDDGEETTTSLRLARIA